MSKYWASYSEFGIYITAPWRGIYQDKGFVAKEEIKLYFEKTGPSSQEYGSIEVFYTELSSIQSAYFDPGKSGDVADMDLKSYHFNRQSIGLTVNVGTQVELSNRWFLDLRCGLGARLNKNQSDLSPSDLSVRYFGDFDLPITLGLLEGTHVVPKLNIGFKVGYRFLYRKGG